MAAVEPQVDPSAAAQVLYERHSERLLGYFVHQLGSRDEAEDAVQTTFLNAVRGLRRGVVPVAEWPWLLTIARNVCLTRWETMRRRRLYEAPRDPHVIEESAPAAFQTAEIPFQQALATLPEQQRRAIVLREWQGLSYREIADELGVSVGAVESLIFRARGSLAKQLRGRRALDLGSLLAGVKSLFAGASVALKIAVIAGVTGATVAAGAATIERTRGGEASRATASTEARPGALPPTAPSPSPAASEPLPPTASVEAAEPLATPYAETIFPGLPSSLDAGRSVAPAAALPGVPLPPLLQAPEQPPPPAPAPAAGPTPPDLPAPPSETLPTLPAAPSTELPKAPSLPSSPLPGPSLVPETPTLSTDPVTEVTDPVVEEVSGVVGGVVDPVVGEVEGVVEDVVAELPLDPPTVPVSVPEAPVAPPTVPVSVPEPALPTLP